jgi:hypothetical protein
MLTLELFVGPELALLARRMICSGPLQTTELRWIRDRARELLRDCAEWGPVDLAACLDPDRAPDVFAGVCWLLSMRPDDTQDGLAERLLSVLPLCKKSQSDLWSCLHLLVVVKSENVVRAHDLLLETFQDPVTDPACKGRLAWLLARQRIDFDPDLAGLVDLCKVCPQDPGPLLLLGAILRHTSHELDEAQLTSLLPTLVRVLGDQQPDVARAAASVVARLTFNLMKVDRVEVFVGAGLVEALLLCHCHSANAIIALTRICRHSKGAYERLVRATDLATILPSLLRDFPVQALALLLQLVAHEHRRDRMWTWLEPSAAIFYRCASTDPHARSVIQWLAFNPKAAAHMVRNKVSKTVRLI